MTIDLHQLAARVNDYDRWRFATNNGLWPTHAIARNLNSRLRYWHIWEFCQDATGAFRDGWLELPPQRTLQRALAQIDVKNYVVQFDARKPARVGAYR